MDISVFGAGYVGLVQAAVLANVGHNVLCIETDDKKRTILQNGGVPMYEPGLQGMVAANCAAGRLRFSGKVADAMSHARIHFIAVGTPSDSGGYADLTAVHEVVKSIAQLAERDQLIVNKSTVPVGTADALDSMMRAILAERGCQGVEVDVVSNPEFLKQGAAVNDCQWPDRIIIGTTSRASIEVLQELYAPFNRNREKMIFMDRRSAELTKYAANCFLATKISYMNEMANLAELFGADIEAVRRGIGADPRIGYDFIYPGCGYGGACFPKDVRALKTAAQNEGFQPAILQAVESVNEAQKKKLGRRRGITQENWKGGPSRSGGWRLKPIREICEKLQAER